MEKALEEKKLAQEKEFSERETVIASREKEYTELKAKVESFPAELSQSVAKAEKTAVAMTENKAKVVAQLLAKEVEGAKPLGIDIQDGAVGNIAVEMKAVYDYEKIYFFARWVDTTRDVIKSAWIFDDNTQHK